MSIAIINPGGITNFGERAIMLGTVYQLRSQYPTEEITIFGYQDLQAEDLKLYDELTSLDVKFQKPIIEGSGKYNRILHAAGLLLSPRSFMDESSYEYLKSSKVFSKGQESFTQDYGLTHFIDSFLEQLIVSRFNRDITLLGHSIGPIYKYGSMSRKVLDRFAMIEVRDSRSYDLLLELGYPANKITQIKDLAYTAVNEYELDDPVSKGHYLIVPNAAICKNEQETESYISNLTVIITRLLERDEHVKIGSSVTSKDWNNDYKLCDVLKLKFDSLEMVHYKTLDEFLIDVKSARMVISSRLHPLIMATGLDTPVFALSKSHKIKGLLGDLGLKSSIVDPFDGISEEALTKI